MALHDVGSYEMTPRGEMNIKVTGEAHALYNNDKKQHFKREINRKSVAEARAQRHYQGLRKSGSGGKLTPPKKVELKSEIVYSALCCVLTSAFIICI